MTADWVAPLGPVAHPVRLASDQRPLLTALASAFGAPRPRPRAGEPPDLVVSGRSDGTLWFRTETDEHPAPDLAHAVERLDALVDEIASARAAPGLLLHASAVLLESGGALLFVGPSGAGKSTTASLLALDGLPFLGDECLVLELSPVPAVLRWRRPLALRPDVLASVEQALDGRRLRRVATSYKTYGYAADLPRKTRLHRAPLEAVVRLDHREAEPDGPDERGRLFRELCSACHYFQRGGQATFRHLAELCRDVRALRMRVGQGNEVVGRVRALVG